jgi:hypothetical protein
LANFCQGCGAPVAGAFCMKCGQPTGTGAPPQASTPPPGVAPPPPQSVPQPQYAPPPQYAQPAQVQYQAPARPATGGGGGFLKVLLIVLVGFLVLAIAGAMGMYYVGRSYLRKAGVISDPAASSYSSSSRSSSPSGSSASSAITGALRGVQDSCDLLSKDEVSAITGVVIEKAVSQGSDSDCGCAYFAKPGENSQRGQEDISKALKNLQAQSKVSDADGQKAMEQIVKGFVNAAGSAANNGAEIPVVSFGITTRDGNAAYTGMMMANKLMGGSFMQIPGLGDDAFIGPVNSIMGVRKGSTFLQIDLRALQDGREKGIAMAQKILGKI